VLYEGHGWIETDVYDRDKLKGGAQIKGPAIVEEVSVSTIMYPGQNLTVDQFGNLIINTGV
jgi:N-methylhydantoinase A